jgi:hypothetical protein
MSTRAESKWSWYTKLTTRLQSASASCVGKFALRANAAAGASMRRCLEVSGIGEAIGELGRRFRDDQGSRRTTA